MTPPSHASTTYPTLFEQVAKAAFPLESKEIEYSLDELSQHAGLSKTIVLDILKKHWIKEDDLDIVFLNLTHTEEQSLYDA